MILLLWSESSNAVVVACHHAFDDNGKRWGGSEKGRRIKVTTEQAQNIRHLKDEGEKITSKPSLPGWRRDPVGDGTRLEAGGASRP